MHPPHADSLTLINAGLEDGVIGTVRIDGSRIAALGESPRAGDRILDVNGERVLPGLINAHDHLQLNSFPHLEYKAPYRNAREWILDINARAQSDQQFAASAALSSEARLRLGGLKNLLSGVTTVAHHDPLYPSLLGASFPIRVVTDYGWSHSLPVDGEEKVRRSYEATSSRHPWIIHAAEGVDHDSANEFEQLHALGCIGPNSLLVHGVALSSQQRARLLRAKAGLIWCPSSNLRMFGKTVEIGGLLAHGRVALGTDSRLTGARDLLDELRVAAAVSRADEQTLEAMVTRQNAQLLRLTDRGVLRAGALADILILPRQIPLSRATRADVRLVMIDGAARYGDKDYAQVATPACHWAEIRVDGRSKVLDSRLAESLWASGATEHGVELSQATGRAA